ncbi:MAG: YjbE family putative metal transport protein [Ktedonobacterales bacterium]|nr:YjbE family putative metal transport protein [Ktedonobacterales bacterium]
MPLENLGILAGIILVDLALSGDNALVIGAAASALPRGQRRVALLVGGAGAIVLRISLAVAATLLLQVPLLQAMGGLVLLLISYRLLADREARRRETREDASAAAPSGAPRGFLAALLTIIVADVTMSLDNVLSVGALAAGRLALLVTGLVISIGILLVGSALVAALIGRFPLLLDVAALVLAGTAARMTLADAQVGAVLRGYAWSGPAAYALAFALVVMMDLTLRWRTHTKLAHAIPPFPTREGG